MMKYDSGSVDKTAYIDKSVEIKARVLHIGKNARIGAGAEEFLVSAGTKIEGDTISIGEGVVIEAGTSIKCKELSIGKDTMIKTGCFLNSQSLVIGERAQIGQNTRIEGRKIKIGSDLWCGRFVTIGGGSCFEVHSSLDMGDKCHIGDYSYINTARPVTIGNEVGLGPRTSLFTHGAYLPVLDGFPVSFGPILIGNRCWLPGATVNPGVSISDDCVVGVGSVVTKSIPPGCLAAGVPAKVIKENVYPKPLDPKEKEEFMSEFLRTFGEICSDKHAVRNDGKALVFDGNTVVAYENDQEKASRHIRDFAKAIIITDRIADKKATVINLEDRAVYGQIDEIGRRLLNQFRRYGMRFRYL